MEDNKNLVEVKNLEVSFFTYAGEVKAVRGISYNLKPGEVMGIVGESGSGKSVSSYGLMGIIPEPGKVIGGRILFEGRDVTAMSEKELLKIRGKDISMIFQDPMTSLNPLFTIGNQIEESLRKHTSLDKDQRQKRMVELLTLVGINQPEKRLKQYPHEFSGGMRQRVMIAMALSCQPSLLIADEPTTALDVTIQAQIMNLLRSLKRELRMSLLLITHDMGLVAQMADRVMVMYAGQIIEEGTVFEIFDHPSHPYTKALLAAVPSMEQNPEEMLPAIEGTVPENYGQMTGCRFRDRCPYRKQGCEAPQELEEIKAEETQKAQELHRVRCWRAKEAEQSGRTL